MKPTDCYYKNKHKYTRNKMLKTISPPKLNIELFHTKNKTLHGHTSNFPCRCTREGREMWNGIIALSTHT